MRKYSVTCPHCGKEFTGSPNGVSLHCFDYILDDCRRMYGMIETGEVECPDCGKSFKGDFKEVM